MSQHKIFPIVVGETYLRRVNAGSKAYVIDTTDTTVTYERWGATHCEGSERTVSRVWFCQSYRPAER